MVVYVVPDTNFLIYSSKEGINIDYEFGRVITDNYEVVVLSCVYNELKKLYNKLKGKDKFTIKLLLSLIDKNYKIVNYNKGTYADDIISNYATDLINNGNKVIVCTNDKILKKKLLDKGIPTMVVRQKRYFEVYNYY